MISFATTLITDGGNATGIDVPEPLMAELTDARKAAVIVTLNGYSYRTSVGWYKGAFKLPVSAEHRAGSGLAAGDPVDVTLELDTAPRVVEVPDDLQAALDTDSEASAAWAKLSYSNQNAHVVAITSAKAEATRQRRVAAALEKLRTT